MKLYEDIIHILDTLNFHSRVLVLKQSEISKDDRHDFWTQLHQDLEEKFTLFDRKEISEATVIVSSALKVIGGYIDETEA